MKQGNSLVTLVIVLLAVMLAAYLGVYAWDSFTDPFTTTLTYSYTANDSLEADGWVVREEQLLPAQSGILDITRAEGEEVGRGQTVALVHQNSQALDVQAQMEELAMEIELLDYAMNQTDDVVSAARLDESILQSLASLRFASASGSYRQLDDDVMELKSQVLKRSYTYGEGLDSSQLSALRQSLIEEYRALRTQSSSVTSRITAPAAGVFSSLADGYESLLTPQSILTMTPADLDALAGQQVTAPSGTAGKLITSDRWYFAAAVSEEEALRLSKESSVTARFSGSFSQDVPMTLEQVGEAVDGRAVVVLSSNRYLSQITLLRGQTVELIFGSSSGLRIPKAALRMVTQESTDPETGETVQSTLVGVYTLVGGRAEFKPVEILTEESDFYVVSPATEGRAVLRAGDEVIVRATGLYDGKLLNF